MEKRGKSRRNVATDPGKERKPTSTAPSSYGTKVDGIKPRIWHVFPIDNSFTQRKMAAVRYSRLRFPSPAWARGPK